MRLKITRAYVLSLAALPRYKRDIIEQTHSQTHVLFNYQHTKQATCKRFDTTGMLYTKTYLDNVVSQRSPFLYDCIYKFLLLTDDSQTVHNFLNFFVFF